MGKTLSGLLVGASVGIACPLFAVLTLGWVLLVLCDPDTGLCPSESAALTAFRVGLIGTIALAIAMAYVTPRWLGMKNPPEKPIVITTAAVSASIVVLGVLAALESAESA